MRERAADHDRARGAAGRARHQADRSAARPAAEQGTAGARTTKAGEKLVEKTVELPIEPQAEPQLAVTPPPKQVEKPVEKKLKQKHASLASAPSTAENKAERAAAPMPGASSHNSDAVPNWKSQLVARLERYKRYPPEAQSRGEHGVAQLAFSVDRSGGVHNARIVRSSGSSVLDRETLSLWSAPRPCRRRRRKFLDRRSRSSCRSATICAEAGGFSRPSDPCAQQPARRLVRRKPVRASPAAGPAARLAQDAPAVRRSELRPQPDRAAWRARWRAPA